MYGKVPLRKKQDEALRFEAELSELSYLVKLTRTGLLRPFDVTVSTQAAVALRPWLNPGVYALLPTACFW